MNEERKISTKENERRNDKNEVKREKEQKNHNKKDEGNIKV